MTKYRIIKKVDLVFDNYVNERYLIERQWNFYIFKIWLTLEIYDFRGWSGTVYYRDAIFMTKENAEDFLRSYIDKKGSLKEDGKIVGTYSDYELRKQQYE